MKRTVRLFSGLGCLILISASVHAQGRSRPRDVVQARAFFAATAAGFTGAGNVIEVRGGPPWFDGDVAPTAGGRFLRRFGRFLYVVNTGNGSITRLRKDGGELRTIDVGVASAPQDVRPTAPGTLYITRRDDPRLWRYDLVTGSGVDAVDLGVLAGANETLMLRTMHSDGGRLFVQLDLRDSHGASRGVLGVVDLVTEQLVDVDPLQPGIQGIQLAGAPPHLRMQVLGRTLFVSTTGDRLDNRGGIERVDLDTLASIGFALTEEQIGGADLGGFVMLSADEGYAVAHTDIIASTHLRHFTLGEGPTPGPDLVTLLGDAVESLAYDARNERLYLPSGFAGFGAERRVFVLDTRTRQLEGMIPTAESVHDLVISR